MITYQEFAIWLSAIVVVQYVALLAIAIRRARFRDRRRDRIQEAVVAHARKFEGPVLTVLLLMALSAAVAATVISTAEYVVVAGIVIASVRIALFNLGVLLLVWYWQQRATWR